MTKNPKNGNSKRLIRAWVTLLASWEDVILDDGSDNILAKLCYARWLTKTGIVLSPYDRKEIEIEIREIK